MRKPFAIASAALAATLLLGFKALAAQSELPSRVDVKDFGAKGDGVSDDTEAIQKAVLKVAAQAKVFHRPWSAGFPELVFPEGVYQVSKTIVLAEGLRPGGGLEKGKPSNGSFQKGMGFLHVRGEGRVVIRQTDSSADIFYTPMGYRLSIEGLNFEGGRSAINVWTGNHDVCMPLIRRCGFAKTSSYAINIPYIKALPDGSFTGYCALGPDGRLRDVESPEAKHFLYHSTYPHIDGCEFTECAKVLFTSADISLMENCRITTSPEMRGAAIVGAGMLKLENIEGVAKTVEGREQRWIDLAFGTVNWIVGRNLKFKSDSGKGLCVVRSLDKFRLSGAFTPNAIILQDSEFDASGCPEDAIVYCEEVPNMVSVSNCVQTGAKPVRALALANPKDSRYFADPPEPSKLPIVPDGLAYMIDDRNRGMSCELPAVMEPYRRTPPPESVSKEAEALFARPKDEIISGDEFKRKALRRIDAAAFGLAGDGVSDDSDAIQRAFDAAAASEGLSEIVFPGSVYKISRFLKLPPKALIRGSGMAAFLASDTAKAGFVAEDARELAIVDCVFESGDKQLEFKIKDGVKAKILVEGSCFSNSCSTAIECRSASASFEGRTASVLRISNSVLKNGVRSIASNVDAIVDSCWIADYGMLYKEGVDIASKRGKEGFYHRRPLADDDPVKDVPIIANEGRMRAENIVGVPLSKGFKRDFRWFDNSGVLACDYYRFGGESSGRMAVKIIAPQPGAKSVTVIQNSWLNHKYGSFYYPDDKEVAIPQTCMVYCETTPALLLMRNNVSYERSYPPMAVMGESVQAKDEAALASLKGRLFMSCEIMPETTGIKKTQADIARLLESMEKGK